MRIGHRWRTALLLGAGGATLALSAAAALVERCIGADQDDDPGAPVDGCTVTTRDGIDLHVEIAIPPSGAVPPSDCLTIVLTHGYCLTSDCWRLQRRALVNAGHRVVTWDVRGHGQSGAGPADRYTIAQVADDLASVIAATVPTGPIVLAGHSMGGMAQLSLAARHDALVRNRVVAAAFIASSPGGLPFANEPRAAALGYQTLRRVGDPVLLRLAAHPRTWAAVRRAIGAVERMLVRRLSFASRVTRQTVRRADAMLFGTPLDVVHAFLSSFDTYDERKSLAAYHGIRLLVVAGERDVLTPPSHARLFTQAWPDADFLLVPRAGHIIMLEHPDAISDALLALAAHSTDGKVSE